MDKQRPFSRAYRSFYSTGKEEGGIVVHLGSGAAAPANDAKEALQGGGGEGAGGGARDAEESRGTPDDIFEGRLYVWSNGLVSNGRRKQQRQTWRTRAGTYRSASPEMQYVSRARFKLCAIYTACAVSQCCEPVHFAFVQVIVWEMLDDAFQIVVVSIEFLLRRISRVSEQMF